MTAEAQAVCLGCGVVLAPSERGRPRKWCSESCRGRHRPEKRPLAPVADVQEVLVLLSRAARAGLVTAQVALLRHYAAVKGSEDEGEGQDPFEELDELAPRRSRPEAS